MAPAHQWTPPRVKVRRTIGTPETAGVEVWKILGCANVPPDVKLMLGATSQERAKLGRTNFLVPFVRQMLHFSETLPHFMRKVYR